MKRRRWRLRREKCEKSGEWPRAAGGGVGEGGKKEKSEVGRGGEVGLGWQRG